MLTVLEPRGKGSCISKCFIEKDTQNKQRSFNNIKFYTEKHKSVTLTSQGMCMDGIDGVE